MDFSNDTMNGNVAEDPLTIGSIVFSFISTMWKEIWDLVSKNPLLSGGAVLSMISMACYYARYVANYLVYSITQYFINYVEISASNVALPWLVDFMYERNVCKFTGMSAKSVLEEKDSSSYAVRHSLLPCFNEAYYFLYNWRLIKVTRVQNGFITSAHLRGEDSGYNSRCSNQSNRYSLCLTTIWVSGSFWNKLLDEVSKAGVIARMDKITIYEQHDHYWYYSGIPRKRRPIETVILQEGLIETIIQDLQRFLRKREWYQLQGLPYRRGYLFYGPPGTGKTSLIYSLAGHFGYSISVLSLSTTLTDAQLNRLINKPIEKTFLLIEDVDVAFGKRVSKDEEEKNEDGNEEKKKEKEAEQKKNTNDITLSGLLNALDGITSSEERIIFMTTNHRENLDPALIRPGRVDVETYIGYCTKFMVEKMYDRFYEAEAGDYREEFVKAAMGVDEHFTPAQLLRHLLSYQERPKEAISQINDLIK